MRTLGGHLYRAAMLTMGVGCIAGTVHLKWKILFHHWVGLILLGAVCLGLFILSLEQGARVRR